MLIHSPSHRLAALIAVVTTAIVTAAVGAAAPAAADPYPGKVVLSEGHVDAIDLQVVDGELTVVLKDDTDASAGAVFRDPADVVLHVRDGAQATVPSGLDWVAPAGSTVWLLPQVEDQELLWPGWATERLPAGYLDAAPTLRLTGVTGPGEVEVWSSNAIGGLDRVFSSDDQLPNGNATPMGSHVHVNWAFTATGAYTLTFEVDAVRDGEAITLGPVDYQWHVGELPDDDPVTTSLSIEGMEPTYEVGDTVTLTAVQDPPIDLDHFHWFVKPAGAEDFVVVDDELEATYAFTATSERDGAQYLVRLYDDDHAVVAESPPVTLQVADPPAPELSQTIVATLDESDGSLVVSVDPDDREVQMGPFELSTDAARWESTGDLRPVRITDTRSGQPGWDVSAQAGDFSSDGVHLGAEHLGWAPAVTDQSPGQGVAAGDAVAPGDEPGEGLSSSRRLASASAGDGLGTATVAGRLDLHVPTSTQPGTYTALITLTAI